MALVVLLRGVNVGGHRTFRPTTLAKQLTHLGAVNIGAAGTFVIRQPVTQAELRAELASRLPFDTEIMICRRSRDCQADVSESFRGPAHSTRHRTLRERPVPTPPHGAIDAHEHPVQRLVAAETTREGRPVCRRHVPAPHKGHRLPRHVRPALWGTRHHAQLEYHDRNRKHPWYGRGLIDRLEGCGGSGCPTGGCSRMDVLVNRRTKLSPSMTLRQFDHGYWYATQLKDFGRGDRDSRRRANYGRTSSRRAIRSFLVTGKARNPTRRNLSTSGIKDVERGLSLELEVVRYTNDKETKSFLERESQKRVPGLTRKSGVRYRFNRWREEQLAKGVKLTYRDLVEEYVRLNQTTQPFASGRVPRDGRRSGRRRLRRSRRTRGRSSSRAARFRTSGCWTPRGVASRSWASAGARAPPCPPERRRDQLRAGGRRGRAGPTPVVDDRPPFRHRYRRSPGRQAVMPCEWWPCGPVTHHTWLRAMSVETNSAQPFRPIVCRLMRSAICAPASGLSRHVASAVRQR